MTRVLRTFTLLALLAGACGCPHRAPSTPAGPDVSWYRKEDLFSAFDPGSRDLSLSNADLLELACFVGDKGTFELDKTLEAWGFSRRRDFRDIQTSTYGYVASNDRMVLVTFGGTDILNVRDLLSDVDALQGVYDARYCASEAARVHRGFRDSLNSVIDGVIEEVRRQAAVAPTSAPTTNTTAADSRGATPPRKALWVAGHSRGGAFAVLAAEAMSSERDLPPLAGVYTFGQPRVGNGAFVRQLEGGPHPLPLYRFVNRDDPVPNVPPEAPDPAAARAADRLGLSLDYRHGGTVVLLREDGHVVRATDADVTRRLPDPRTAGASVANHYQPAYQAAIYAALSNPQLVEEPTWRAGVESRAVQALPPPAK